MIIRRKAGGRPLAALAGLIFVSFTSTACVSTKDVAPAQKEPLINEKTKFSSEAYGVKGSPRVTTSKNVKKGGGRYQVGKGYKVKGQWYYPKEDPNYQNVGLASWYGPNFHGRLTANGEIYDQYALSAAHKTMPLPSYAKVTNLENGSSVIVRVNDRGPFHGNREIDLSNKAAEMLGYKSKGVAKVKVEYVGKARMDGHDEKYLLASYIPAKGSSPQDNIVPGGTMSGTMLASVDTPSRNQVDNGLPGVSTRPLPTENQPPVLVAAVEPSVSVGSTAAYSSSSSIASRPVGAALNGSTGGNTDLSQALPQSVVAAPNQGGFGQDGLRSGFDGNQVIPETIQATGGTQNGLAPVPAAAVRPMGYMSDKSINSRIKSAFKAVLMPTKDLDEVIENSLLPRASQVEIDLGDYADLQSAEQVEKAIEDYSVVKIEELDEGYSVVAYAEKSWIPAVLKNAHSLGIKGAKITKVH